MRQDPEQRDPDPRVERQAEAAAREAAAIGGPDPEPGVDPAERPLVEGGEGVAEGFEQAEEQLERYASHADRGTDPIRDAGQPEPDAARSTAAYGEADSAQSQDDVDGDEPIHPTKG